MPPELTRTGYVEPSLAFDLFNGRVMVARSCLALACDGLAGLSQALGPYVNLPGRRGERRGLGCRHCLAFSPTPELVTLAAKMAQAGFSIDVPDIQHDPHQSGFTYQPRFTPAPILQIFNLKHGI
jgi:hypothetical protein